MRLLNVGGYQQYNKLKSKYKWIIVDIDPRAAVTIDISDIPLPFGDESVDAIYCSHTLEHIDLDRLPFVFSEFYRVLKKEAKMRIVVPDWDIAIGAYCRKDFRFLAKTKVVADEKIYPDIPLINLFSWAYSYHLTRVGREKVVAHKTPFNQEVLSYFLQRCGFDRVYLKGWQDKDKLFNGLDLEGHKKCSLYMEAIK